ncbi:amidohydrolase family protein [Pseudenhygromyxa sp. WMMC2535]|uniref:N-acyl-D-amino-acid deacylase family protein n=1 Tax=Pseudenhygromyxa sp. WMMC2535 TaxID=2712867 RepID=UPI0015541642|nr:amidohydrolase family protein [Pseudenhygromyxa sp. WMMC2535]NVB42729.1 amidohydrolase family protein [Pseudenhygromyxa sp. WMMC2535]
MQEDLATSEGEPVLIRGAEVFDGLGGPPRRVDVLVRGGVVEAMLAPGEAGPEGARIIDAAGCWLTPGFIDLHTHYDAELEIAPSLGESLRHGVTTVVIGSCGLSMAVGDPVDLADMFCRVEGIPRATVKPTLERVKTWDGPRAYFEHLDGLPLGPNVAAFLGHSAIRAATMGLGPSLDANHRPSAGELAGMLALVDEALDAGFIGLSINTLPWDKMDGEQFRSLPTPSVFASWSEYRALARRLRARKAVLQGVPNISTKVNVLLFALLSAGLLRPGLKTSLIAMMDAPAARGIHRIVGLLTRVVNRLLGGDLRFQALPNPFDMRVDGIEVPVFEEIGAGTEALHHEDPEARAALLRDPGYRRRFKRQWRNPILGRAYHRDLAEPRIEACPDPALIGRSFADIAAERGLDPIDLMLDLVAEYGDDLEWFTVVANDRPRWLDWIIEHPGVLIGFSDAGAHLRNMAYYNFPLRMLARVREREVMTPGQAVRRLSSEIADWLGLDAGRVEIGARADLVIIDPEALDGELEAVHEAPMPGFEGLSRLVRRNDRAVRHVFVGGREAWAGGAFCEGVGRERGFGRVLRAQHG